MSGELRIRCGCGAQIEGHDEQMLLAAFDDHLATAHRGAAARADGRGSSATTQDATGLTPTDGGPGPRS